MRIKKIAVVVATAGIVALGGATPAYASTASIRIGSTSGAIVAKGAAATLIVHFSCPAGYIADVFGSLTQTTRQRLTNTGYNSAAATCTGSPQTTRLYVTGVYAWKRGDALASASLSACDVSYNNCVNVSTSKVIALT
jgi:hypothetical protein